MRSRREGIDVRTILALLQGGVIGAAVGAMIGGATFGGIGAVAGAIIAGGVGTAFMALVQTSKNKKVD